MLTVYKYPFDINDYFELDLPEGAMILKLDMQFEKPVLWALVDPSRPLIRRTFRLAGTGHPIKESFDQLFFHGTFSMMGGSLIWHVFEIGNWRKQ